MANPFDVGTDPFTAALQHARAGYAGKSRAALMEPKSDDHLAATKADVPDAVNLDNPSAFESILKTVGLPGYGIRNLLKGNVEGTARNLADFISSPLRAILPGDQSSWELSRKEDLPEFSDVIGGMEPGLAKTGVDLLGNIATDPFSLLGVGEFSAAAKAAKAANVALKAATATKDAAKIAEAAKAVEVANDALKASRAAGETKSALGLGKAPFMAPALEIPGSASALEAAGRGIKAVTPPIVTQGLNLLKRTAGAVKVADWARPIIAKAEAVSGGTSDAQVAALQDALKGMTEDEGRKLFGAIQNVEREGGLQTAGGVAKPLYDESGLTAPYRATQDVLSRTASNPLDIPALSHSDISLPIRGSKVQETIDPLSQMLGRSPVKATTAEKIGPLLDEPGNFGLSVSDPRFVQGIELANRMVTSPISDALSDRALRAMIYSSGEISPELRAEVQGMTRPELLEMTGPAGEKITPNIPATAKGLPTTGASGPAGGKPIPSVSRTGAEMADVTAATNMAQGGTVPELQKVGAADLPDASSTWGTDAEHVANIVQGLQKQGVQGPQLEKLTKAATKWVEMTRTAFGDLVKAGSFEAPVGRDLTRESPRYAMRMFSGPESEIEQALGKATGTPSAAKATKLKPGQSVADYLNENPTSVLESNLALMGAKRAGQQASMMGRTTLAKDLVEKYGAQAEAKIRAVPSADATGRFIPEADRIAQSGMTEAEQAAYKARWSPLYKAGSEGSDLGKAAMKVIEEVGKEDPETAKVLLSAYSGLPPRGWLSQGLANVNNLFKPYATAGAFIPRINFNVRNVIGNTTQIGMNPESRSQTVRAVKNITSNIWRSIDDGLEQLTGSRILRSDNEFAQFNDALAAGKGSREATAALIQNPRLREAYLSGVITDGFARSELLANQMTRTGWSKKWRDIRDWPAHIAKGAEQRSRLTLFDGLRNEGKSIEDAARITQDSLFNYNISSTENRTAREAIPFFMYSAKSVPLMAKFLAEKPAAAVGLNALYSQSDNNTNPVPPWAQSGINIPLGKGETGNPQYLSSLGLPFDILSQIPNPSDNLGNIIAQTRQGILGQANPAIKTLIAAGGGNDPRTGQAFLSNDRTPAALQAFGLPERGDLARYFNAATSTGVVQPLAAPLQALSSLLDKRQSIPVAALNTLTGMKVIDVDEQQALRQILEDAIRRDPSIKSSANYYQLSKTPEGSALLQKLQDIRKQLKAKRQSQP